MMRLEEFVELVKKMDVGSRFQLPADPRTSKVSATFAQAAAVTLSERSMTIATDAKDPSPGRIWWVIPACQCEKCRAFASEMIALERYVDQEMRAAMN